MPTPPDSSARTIANQTLLLFSIGPVQDFIAAARTTRDLWSGSYLLSTLIASALGKIQHDHETAAVVFPHIADQPLVNGTPKSTNNGDISAFLTPTLPNRLLAILPESVDAAAYAKELKNAVRDKLQTIATDVANGLNNNLKAGASFHKDNFISQAERLLEVQWQTLPVTSAEDAYAFANSLPANEEFDPCKHVSASSSLDELWGPLNASISWLQDGAKSLRSFNAWRKGRWESGNKFFKDTLNGKEEVVFVVSNQLDKNQVKELAGQLKLNKEGGLKKGEMLGASSVIKRFWDVFHLAPKLNLTPDDLRSKHPMPNTHRIAKYDNKKDGGNEEGAESDKYFAIIAMDGDEMGKWISGQKFDRAMSPDDHREFSDILNEFSVNQAAGLVEDSVGKLIYSGGDDVLAMVPAGYALDCALDLKDAFISAFKGKNAEKYKEMNASIGIAIAHYKAPLQDVVKAAQAAEKRAKCSPDQGGHGRGAVAITIYKRSGEILEWGSRWDNTGISLLGSLLKDLKGKKLKTRFPHKLEAQLTPYLPQSESIATDENFAQHFSDILEKEVAHTLKRNEGGALGETKLEHFTDYWNGINTEDFTEKLKRFINLLRTAAWMARGYDEKEANKNSNTQEAATH
ncbi:MAG: type III-B CRISPR-associated protein Cas10/Cmr2 [Akkermansiaceae bacterium]|nr:type III-B CRISPR-associated protein Cas10/Cmr2 [Akkermansiaceae bacterium]